MPVCNVLCRLRAVFTAVLMASFVIALSPSRSQILQHPVLLAATTQMSLPEIYTILITGANSGLGFATCCRLLDEFLSTRPHSQSLHLVLTTRSEAKSKDTLTRLRQHLHKSLTRAYGTSTAILSRQEQRVQLEGETCELTDLVSVKRLARRIVHKEQKIDVLICNAGIGGWKGLDWTTAIWTVLTGMPESTTYPTYKLGHVGRTLKQDVSPSAREQAGKAAKEAEAHPVLGETFAANVFGHYMLAHWLMPVLQSSRERPEASRIVWISSIEAYGRALDMDDMQGLKTDQSYESSKRLTDVLALTSELPSTQPWVRKYTSASPSPSSSALSGGTKASSGPRILVCHPGICATSIFDLPLLLQYAMLAAFYISRWIGSPWHPISAYLGAVAGVWLALVPDDVLESLEGPLPGCEQTRNAENDEGEKGKAKWGSSTDRVGGERVIRTEVDGWGWSGRVGEKADGGIKISRGRYKGMPLLDRERREEFEETGRRAWKEMEDLRLEWERRLQHID